MYLFINFLKCALISTLLLFTTSLMAATKLKPYAPRVDLIAKVGNKRHIARLGTVIPLLQKPNFMCYFTAIGMRDSKSSTEGNFGLGFRWLSSKSITGFYGFYDLRKSAAGNKFNQITLGFEKLYRSFEFRANFYLPFLDSKEASNRTISNVGFVGHNAEIVLLQRRVIERPMKGLDLEFGGTFPRHRALSTHIAFYSFVGHRVESVAGARWRADYRFSPWFAMNAEANYDKARKFSGYVGLKLSYSMGQSKRGIKVNSLRDKMTMLPVRDIDIVVGDGDEVVDLIRIANFNQNLNRTDQDVKRSITLLRDRYGVISDDERRRLENEIETLLDNLQRVGHVGIPHGLSLEQENAYRNDGRYNERLRAIVAKRTLERILNEDTVHTVTTLGGVEVPLRDALIYVYKSIRGVGIEHDENFDRVGRAKDFVRALYEMGREFNHDADSAAPGRYRIRIGEREQVFFDDRLPDNGGRGNDNPACSLGHYNKLVETLNMIDPAVNFGGRFDMLAHSRIQELLRESFSRYREDNRDSAGRILAQSELGVDEDNRAASQEWLTFLADEARPHIHEVMRREFYINHQNPANQLATQQELDNWTGVEDALIYMDLVEDNAEN